MSSYRLFSCLIRGVLVIIYCRPVQREPVIPILQIRQFVVHTERLPELERSTVDRPRVQMMNWTTRTVCGGIGIFLFFYMDLRFFNWISHKYLLLILLSIDSLWKCLIQIILKLSSAVSGSSVSVYQVSLWLAAPKFFLGKIRQCENLFFKRLLRM